MMVTAALLFSMTFIFALASGSDTADAKRYKKRQHDRIRIESFFSPNKFIIASIRPARDGGTEVQLPSGRWIHCAGSCTWTVQKEYLDFWQAQQTPFGRGYIKIERYFD